MNGISRREFMISALSAGSMLCPVLLTSNDRTKAHKAKYYEKLEHQVIRCTLCPWQCVVANGKRGHCEVRINRDGEYYSMVYGQVAAQHVDPIEKKPFYHFLPGSMAFSIATAGCNVECKFCQNADLAQRRPEELRCIGLSPERVVQSASQAECRSVAYTYNEPVIFMEFMQDIASIAREQGIRSVVVSNGFVNQKPLRDLCRVIDAYKVDLKAFTEDYYEQIVHGRLQPVLDTLVTLKQENIWTEIVYLVVPTLNDDTASLKALVKWVNRELGPDVPLHFSRFYPQYKLRNLPPTPLASLEKAYQIARDAGLHYVYLGNVPEHPGGNTECSACHRVLIRRTGYQIFENHIHHGKCEFCQQPVAGIWN